MQLGPHAIHIRPDGSCLQQRVIPRGRCCNRYISEFHDRQFTTLEPFAGEYIRHLYLRFAFSQLN
jgi:hypothetical protein